MLEQLSAIVSKRVESIKDAVKEVTTKSFKESSPLRSSMEIIENTSLESLKARVEDILNSMPEIKEGRPLTEEEIAHYNVKLGCSDALLKNATIDENGRITIKTINDGKEGKEGENGVKYERKTVVVNGVEVEGVFPVFESANDVQLPEELIKATDAKQAEFCNQQLKAAVESDPELAKRFTPEQLEQIRNGETPDGYTWHHNEDPGKMQLIKTEDHQANRHTGGKAIWGSGSENR